MKRLITIFISIMSISSFAGEGSHGGGPLVTPSAKSVLQQSSKISDLVGYDNPFSENKTWKVQSEITFVKVDNPTLINLIKLKDGFDLTYPERGEIINTNEIDTIDFINGSSLKFINN